MWRKSTRRNGGGNGNCVEVSLSGGLGAGAGLEEPGRADRGAAGLDRLRRGGEEGLVRRLTRSPRRTPADVGA